MKKTAISLISLLIVSSLTACNNTKQLPNTQNITQQNQVEANSSNDKGKMIFSTEEIKKNYSYTVKAELTLYLKDEYAIVEDTVKEVKKFMAQFVDKNDIKRYEMFVKQENYFNGVRPKLTIVFYDGEENFMKKTLAPDLAEYVKRSINVRKFNVK